MSAKSSSYTAAGQVLQTQHDNSPRGQLLVQKSFLDARTAQLAKWVRGGVRPEALIRFALLDMQTNDKLRACTPESIYLVLLACASLGLEPGALRGECYAVPFAGRATFIMGYRGYLKLARRSGEIVGLVANVVRERDEFAIDIGTANSITHRPARGDRGDTIGAYAIATLKGGHHELEYMDRDDLDKIQRIAEKRGKSPAWQDFPDEMRRKTLLRRLGKRLPLGDQYFTAAAIEDAGHEGGDQRPIIDLVTDGAGSQSESQLAKAPIIVESSLPEDVDPNFDPADVGA